MHSQSWDDDGNHLGSMPTFVSLLNLFSILGFRDSTRFHFYSSLNSKFCANSEYPDRNINT